MAEQSVASILIDSAEQDLRAALVLSQAPGLEWSGFTSSNA
jgi:hypothetical protein